MPEQTYKSPNFYEREIDLSAFKAAAEPVGVPAAVIGTSNKGPAFVPVTFANLSEFSKTFGNLDFRHYGPYAVNEFLKNRSALTYLRVLGAGANSTQTHLDDMNKHGIVHNAGFRLISASAGDGVGRSNCVVQFLVAEHQTTVNEQVSCRMFTDNDTNVDAPSLAGGLLTLNLVRGLIMTPSSARVMICSSSTTPDNATISGLYDTTAADSDGKFKLIISSTLPTFYTSDGMSGVRILTASFDPTSKDYFGKVLNTDPDKFYQEQHYLHADFSVDANAAAVVNASTIGILSGSSNSSADSMSGVDFGQLFGRYDTRFKAPETSYFISQPFGKSEFELFKFEALDDGEYANSLYKISISNVKASVNDAYPYGTFNVQIRSWDDTDTSLNVIEQFSNCSLDPNAENYVARLIGDRKVFYNFDTLNPSERRIVATGKYDNKSKYVRITMADAVEKGLVPQTAVPFGFRGPPLLKVNPPVAVTAGSELLKTDARLSGYLDSSLPNTATCLTVSSSFLPPVPFRFKVTRGEITGSSTVIGETGPAEQANPAYYWGVKFERFSTASDPNSMDILNANVVNEKNSLLESYTKFVGIEKMDALLTGSSVDSLNNNKFSLSNVVLNNTSVEDLTSSINAHMRESAYVRNAVLDPSDYTWNDGSTRRMTFATLLASGSASVFNRFSAYSKFTNFMHGGFDGTNFLNRDSRRLNDKSVSYDPDTFGGASTANNIPGFVNNPSGADVSNNGVASYLAAIDIITNPLDVNHNVMAIPGIREPFITDDAMAKIRDYGLSMYVMDVPSYDDDGYRLYDDSVGKTNVISTVNKFDERAIDNNYVAVYFPEIYVNDDVNRRKVKVPASVAALGALGFNDRVAYPWFAPAGFNRAALDFVTNVAVRLSVADRDRLYESRINPIATFPRLGFVIYGQKTLQVKKSALDRVNVRRLMLEIKRIVIGIANRLVFEQNTAAVRNKFVADVSFQLGLVQAAAGIEGFQVICNESNNTQEDYDLNRLNGRIVVVPTRVVEYISIDFIVTNSGVQFV